MERFFIKPNGVIVQYNELYHDIKSLEERFEECNADGTKPKAKKEKKEKKSDK
tara:strand:+ start:526 stop:684 length:159 start_codon:yes stop_codon:yes gene_type:complete